MITMTPVTKLRVGDKLALDSGNYVVTIEHVALVRGLEVKISYRHGRSVTLQNMTMSKFKSLPKVD